MQISTSNCISLREFSLPWILTLSTFVNSYEPVVERILSIMGKRMNGICCRRQLFKSSYILIGSTFSYFLATSSWFYCMVIQETPTSSGRVYALPQREGIWTFIKLECFAVCTFVHLLFCYLEDYVEMKWIFGRKIFWEIANGLQTALNSA